ncbi:MAG TPA: cytochrome c3 family protein [Burkholderiaceae bacterium]|nr:cytochrome c3 family protein [Burkholderiaceae bacterium]
MKPRIAHARILPRAGAACVAALLALAIGIGQAAEYGDVPMPRKVKGMDDIPAATFPHWIHRMQYRCGACHNELFKMKAGSDTATMDDMRAGSSCGKCHNGKIAFESNFDTCNRCHRQ